MFVLIKKRKLKLSDSYSLCFSLWRSERIEKVPKRKYVSKLSRIIQSVDGSFSPHHKTKFLEECEQLLEQFQLSRKEKRKIWNRIYSFVPPLTRRERYVIKRWRNGRIIVPL